MSGESVLTNANMVTRTRVWDVPEVRRVWSQGVRIS